ncbi:MAG: ABC transporter ATP-binding protein [Halanaerobiales bacterium]|nr:ABC transporter ATP-binding protein [Halanaerobiales bacterium]
MMSKLLDINDLKVYFNTEEGVVKALAGVNFKIDKGSFHGLIGETGCGKSVTGLSILKLLDNNALIEGGKIIYKDENLLDKTEKQMQRDFRGNEIAMIFQDPGSSLNPVFTIQDQIQESVKMYKKASKQEYRNIVIEELKKVKLPDVEGLLDKYPHQLSGGMKQRVMIAMMLACNPNLLIADEPTTALDVSIQAQFLQVLKNLKEKFDMTVLYITHDLAVVSEICDYVSVMYAGRIVENVPVRELFKNPIHPYSYKLVHSVLGVKTLLENLEEIPGSVPRLIDPPSGCRFHPRCEEATDICKTKVPQLKKIGKNHYVACHRR